MIVASAENELSVFRCSDCPDFEIEFDSVEEIKVRGNVKDVEHSVIPACDEISGLLDNLHRRNHIWMAIVHRRSGQKMLFQVPQKNHIIFPSGDKELKIFNHLHSFDIIRVSFKYHWLISPFSRILIMQRCRSKIKRINNPEPTRIITVWSVDIPPIRTHVKTVVQLSSWEVFEAS